jgi:hypothetical protein
MGTLAQKACNGAIELGPTPTDLVELRSWNYDQQGAVLDLSTMGACDSTEVAGRVTRRVEGTLYLADPTDAAQALIVVGDNIAVVVYPFGKSTGKLSLTGTMDITGRTESGDVDGGVELAWTGTAPAELARGTVT